MQVRSIHVVIGPDPVDKEVPEHHYHNRNAQRECITHTICGEYSYGYEGKSFK